MTLSDLVSYEYLLSKKMQIFKVVATDSEIDDADSEDMKVDMKVTTRVLPIYITESMSTCVSILCDEAMVQAYENFK